jgi:hypothetical protein
VLEFEVIHIFLFKSTGELHNEGQVECCTYYSMQQLDTRDVDVMRLIQAKIANWNESIEQGARGLISFDKEARNREENFGAPEHEQDVEAVLRDV